MNKRLVKYCIEDLKYRFIGMFPYLDKDMTGNISVYESYTSVDGCYNKIACALKLPVDFIVDGKTILNQGESYNFRTLYNLYKKYSTLKNNSFIEFMKRGIGKIKVTASINFDECPLVPYEINLAECPDIYNEMSKLKILVDNYKKLLADGGNKNCQLECLVSKYEHMGGDTMLAFYKSKINENQSVSDEYFTYADLDNTNFSVDVLLTTSYHDMGSFDAYTDIWVYYEKYNKGDLVVYNGITYVCNEKNPEPIWDEEYCEYKMDTTKFTPLLETMSGAHITGKSDSKLRSFAGIKHYVNEASEVETPEMRTDWLYFYRVGQMASYNVTRDENNNIAIFDGAIRNLTINGDYEHNLVAFGDIITDITCSPDDKTITFKYALGVHLMSKLLKIDMNELNQPIYYYSEYAIDADSLPYSVKYTETYKYDEYSDINKLVELGMFDTYVNTRNIIPGYEYIKGVFSTEDNTMYDEMTFNGDVFPYNYIETEFDVVTRHDSMTTYPIIRQDYYDTIGFAPDITNNVRFSRGNATAFERHIKLGEVKSFDDFLNYSNGGFFNVL